jgi:hypothetical protein
MTVARSVTFDRSAVRSRALRSSDGFGEVLRRRTKSHAFHERTQRETSNARERGERGAIEARASRDKTPHALGRSRSWSAR